MNATERAAAREHAARTTIIDTAEIRAKRAWQRFTASPASSVALAAALVVLGSVDDFPLPL